MRKKTKIVVTISDRNCEPELIQELFDNGMNLVRLNTAHQDCEGSLKVINNIRKVSDKIAILVDTKGPEIRITSVEKNFEVKKNEIVKIKGDPEKVSSRECIYITYKNIVNDLSINSKILIDDGSIELTTIEKKDDYLICRVENDGIVEGKKSINIPYTNINLPALSPKDIEYINFAIEHDLDFIAHSFVRKKEDIIAVKSILEAKNSNIKIIAKIENQEGVDNIDEILDYAYGVMIARGDLAIEIPAKSIPRIQKQIIDKCIKRRKPVIVATQMLHSMISNPRPTRAEISDVANAVYDGTDAIMLSGETAYGKYPVESVKIMSDIAKDIEANTETYRELPPLVISTQVSAFLVKSAVKAGNELPVTAIVTDTTSGRTVRALAAFRGKNTIYAQCYSKQTMRKLALSYGVYVDFIEHQKSSHEFLYEALKRYSNRDEFQKDNLILVIAGNFNRSKGANFIEIGTVEDLMEFERIV